MIIIYHNPRCSKSRQGLALIESSQKPFKIIKYLEETLTESELGEIIEKLNLKPIQLTRTNETIWKEHYKNKNLTDAEIIKALAKYPKLIERPIVINGQKGVIGRPPETILSIL